MREIVLDVETTGLQIGTDRITDIAVVELFDKMPTGSFLQFYVNPTINVSDESIRISGLTNEFLSSKPIFAEIWSQVSDFISNSTIVAHNSKFDIGMINFEISLLGLNPVKNKIIDTLEIARKIFSTSNRLDNLAKRFKINRIDRKLHGALKDCYILGSVYYHLSIEDMEIIHITETKKEEKFIMQSRINPAFLTQDEKELNDFFFNNIIK